MDNKKLILELAEKFFPEVIGQEFEDSDTATQFYADVGEKLADIIVAARCNTMLNALDTWQLPLDLAK